MITSSQKLMMARAGAGGVAGVPWEIYTATAQAEFSVSAQSDAPYGLTFKTDGTAFYVAGIGVGVWQYALSTAWDVTSASYVQSLTGMPNAQPTGISFKDDGTRLFISNTGDDIERYDLSTAWDLSTASYVGDYNRLTGGGQRGSTYADSGTKFYQTSFSGLTYRYSLGTAWTLPSGSPDQTFNATTSGNITYAQGVFLKPDGTKMYISGDNSVVDQYDLSTAWDMSTASFVDSLTTSFNQPRSMYIKSDGTRAYILSQITDKIHQFTME
ncbi:hypothetical protein N8468_04640 [Planktomarina temperata]|nr:hypothetical protein [Planktomarina temperata]